MVHRIQASLDESSIKQVAQIADEFCGAPVAGRGFVLGCINPDNDFLCGKEKLC